AAVAAEREHHLRTVADAARDREAAITAAAADALREQAGRAVALGHDDAGAFRGGRAEHAAGVATAVTGTADRRADRAPAGVGGAGGAAGLERPGPREAAGAAATADALREQAVRVVAARRDLAGARDEHIAPDAGLLAIAAEAEVGGCALRDRARDCETAVT